MSVVPLQEQTSKGSSSIFEFRVEGPQKAARGDIILVYVVYLVIYDSG